VAGAKEGCYSWQYDWLVDAEVFSATPRLRPPNSRRGNDYGINVTQNGREVSRQEDD
jgi:hypothetical protein